MVAVARSTTTALALSRTLLLLLRRSATSSRKPLELSAPRPTYTLPSSQSRAAAYSSTTGDPSPPPPTSPTMDSPIKVVSHIGGSGGGGGAAIDAGRSARKPLSLWPGMYHSPVTNALWEARSSIFERMIDAGAAGKEQQPPQTELLTKTPAQSRTSIVYKFSTDDILREQYRDPWNEVRIGKLLEDLDALAGTIAVKSDLIALTANFTFVTRDSMTGKSAPVNRLSPETEKEKQLFGEREARDKLRKRKREEQKGLDNPEQPLVNVEVVAHVTRPQLRKSEVSNTLHFTFTICSDALKNGLKIRHVVPSTEEEARRILERMDAEGLFD
ncbi:hypothetical protein E2562_026460 [Oryza meyeriana var. granulata]|uniref:Thioesterase domain-containing protein n=1 Tax=Oryza meyeriana var. granulata TaxID=110450 RepID=A0A6G1DNG4_9ORYZ|nr:hypothetical protein E2562_026460 [Oryza meyeriana var. granulata]